MKKIILILFSFILFTQVDGQTSIAKAQAMFIYNFSRLISWPSEYQTGDFVIGILGTSNIESELEGYCATKKVGFQNIIIKSFKNPEDLTKCHILFVSYGKTSKMAEILSSIQGKSTLIIAEKRGAIDDGAAINFIIGEDRLKFELKVGNASKYGLKISSKLQEMAIMVN
ncbi:MAG: YfiR family protein [bacterium]